MSARDERSLPGRGYLRSAEKKIVLELAYSKSRIDVATKMGYSTDSKSKRSGQTRKFAGLFHEFLPGSKIYGAGIYVSTFECRGVAIAGMKWNH